MKPHPIDLFSLISGAFFGLVAVWLYTGANWAWPSGEIGRIIAPSILLLIGFAILMPRKSKPPSVAATSETDAEAKAHEELPPQPLDY